MSNFIKGVGLGLLIGYAGTATIACLLLSMAYIDVCDERDRIKYPYRNYNRFKTITYDTIRKHPYKKDEE